MNDTATRTANTTTAANTPTAIIPLCRHIKTNGRQCQSPALRGGAVCFYHAKLRNTHRRPEKVESLYSGWQEFAIENEGDPEGDILTVRRVYPHQDEIVFPPLEDAESIQLATSMLFQAIATGNIYFKRAKLLLYTLKIASINQRALANSRAAERDQPAPTHLVCTPQGQILASPAEPQPSQTEPQLSPAAPLSPASPPAAQASNLTPHSSVHKPEARRADHQTSAQPGRAGEPAPQTYPSAGGAPPIPHPSPLTQTESVFCP